MTELRHILARARGDADVFGRRGRETAIALWVCFPTLAQSAAGLESAVASWLVAQRPRNTYQRRTCAHARCTARSHPPPSGGACSASRRPQPQPRPLKNMGMYLKVPPQAVPVLTWARLLGARRSVGRARRPARDKGCNWRSGLPGAPPYASLLLWGALGSSASSTPTWPTPTPAQGRRPRQRWSRSVARRLKRANVASSMRCGSQVGMRPRSSTG